MPIYTFWKWYCKLSSVGGLQKICNNTRPQPSRKGSQLFSAGKNRNYAFARKDNEVVYIVVIVIECQQQTTTTCWYTLPSTSSSTQDDLLAYIVTDTFTNARGRAGVGYTLASASPQHNTWLKSYTLLYILVMVTVINS